MPKVYILRCVCVCEIDISYRRVLNYGKGKKLFNHFISCTIC